MIKLKAFDKKGTILKKIFNNDNFIIISTNKLILYSYHCIKIKSIKIKLIITGISKFNKLYILNKKGNVYIVSIENEKNQIFSKHKKNVILNVYQSINWNHNFKRFNIHQFCFLDTSEKYILIGNITGTFLIYCRKIFNLIQIYENCNFLFDFKITDNFIYAFCKDQDTYKLECLTILEYPEKCELQQEYFVPSESVDYTVIGKKYDLLNSYIFYLLEFYNDQIFVFTGNKILYFNKFQLIYTFDCQIRPLYHKCVYDRWLIIDENNKMYELCANSHECSICMIDLNISDIDCRENEQCNLFRSAIFNKDDFIINTIHSGIIRLINNEIEYHYYNGEYYKCNINEKRKIKNLEFESSVRNFFVSKKHIFAITNKIEVIYSNKIVTDTFNDLLFSKHYNFNSTLTEITDIFFLNEQVIILFPSFFIYNNQQIDIEYSSYFFDDENIVFSNELNVIIFTVNQNSQFLNKKVYKFECVIFQCLKYKNFLYLQTGDKILRIYNINEDKMCNVQFFNENVKTFHLSDNFLVILSSNIQIYKMNKNGSLTFKLKKCYFQNIIQEKIITTERNRMILLTVYNNNSFIHYMIKNYKIKEIENDTFILDNYIIHIKDEKVIIKQINEKICTNIERKDDFLNIENMLFHGKYNVFNLEEGLFVVKQDDKNIANGKGKVICMNESKDCIFLLVNNRENLKELKFVYESNERNFNLRRNYEYFTIRNNNIYMSIGNQIFMYNFQIDHDKQSLQFNPNQNEVFIKVSSEIIKMHAKANYLYILTKNNGFFIYYNQIEKYSFFENKFFIDFWILKDDLILTCDVTGLLEIYAITDRIYHCFDKYIGDLIISALFLHNQIYILARNGTKYRIEINKSKLINFIK